MVVVGGAVVVGGVVVVPENLQAEARKIDESAAPIVKRPALFRTWRLEYFVTQKIPLFPLISFLSLSDVFISYISANLHL